MDNNFENNFEKFPSGNGEVSGERMAEAAKWDMSTGVPEFAGKQFGVANETNDYYGETVQDEENVDEQFDKNITNAAALINYGLNAAAREYGVEAIIQKLKGFDASGREDPIKDFFEYIGVKNPEEKQEVRAEAAAAAPAEAEFREGPNQPSQKKSVEGAFAAIDDMKGLIAEVEGANPKYEALREGARAAGKGYFEYAVSEFGVQDLTKLFQVLAAQKEQAEQTEQIEQVEQDEQTEQPEPGTLVEMQKQKELDNQLGSREDRIIKNAKSLNPEILGKNAA